jgi:hypothetical protein
MADEYHTPPETMDVDGLSARQHEIESARQVVEATTVPQGLDDEIQRRMEEAVEAAESARPRRTFDAYKTRQKEWKVWRYTYALTLLSPSPCAVQRLTSAIYGLGILPAQGLQ